MRLEIKKIEKRKEIARDDVLLRGDRDKRDPGVMPNPVRMPKVPHQKRLIQSFLIIIPTAIN